MIEKRCYYNGNEYNCKIKKNNVIIFSSKEEGFIPCKDLLGNVIKGCFSKIVNIDDVDEIYNLRYMIKYSEMEFEILSLNINAIKNNKLTITTQDEKLASDLGFEKHEQFVFLKEIETTKKTKIICYKEYINKDKTIEKQEILLEDLLNKNDKDVQ